MLTRPTRMLAVIISLMVYAPIRRGSPWRYLRSSIGSSRPRQSASNLLEHRVIGLEVRGQEVRRRIFLPRGLLHESVPFEEAEMVSHGPVVEAEDLRQLVRVARSAVQRLEDPRPVRAAPRARDQEPEQLPQRRAHGGSRAVRKDRLKRVSWLSSPRDSSRRSSSDRS